MKHILTMDYRTALLFAAVASIFVTASNAEELSVVENEKTLDVLAGDKVILKYNIAEVPSPDKEKPYYARSGHIHPVFTPKGHAVTGDMCPDHIHQHGIWFAWTSAIIGKRKIDFWNSHVQQGKIRHATVLQKGVANNTASFQVQLDHVDTTSDTLTKVLTETWTVSVQAKSGVYVIDLESNQSCATDKPLQMKKYHYGAMGLRSPMAWNEPEGGFLTSDGNTRENGNHTRPKWVDSFGPTAGDTPMTVGITVMQHPSNFRYPQPVRLHPKFSYFCYAPMVLGDFAIEPGKKYVSRFRYVVHDGAIDEAVTKKLWDEFAEN